MNKSIEEELIEMFQELTEGDPDFLEELISAYIENLEEFRTEASIAVRNLDLDLLKANLHKINPTLLTIKYDGEYETLANMKDHLNESSIEGNQQIIKLITTKAIDQLENIKNKF